MGEWDDTTVQRYGGQPPREPSDACAEDGVLAAVLSAANGAEEDDHVGAALDALVSALGLSRASVAVVREDGDLLRLVPIAAAGEHASFARDMPAVPLEQMADAAVTVTERRALYVGDVHGLGDRSDEADTGVARWRSGMSAQAEALLPVIARDRVAGVLTLEWSTPQAFTTPERESLQGVALLFGLILGLREPAGPPEVTPAPEVELPAELPSGTLLSYGVTDRGVVVPAAAEGSPGEDVVVHVTVCAGEPAETTSAFWDVVGVRSSTLVIVGGTVQAPRGDAASLAATCAATLRSSCAHGRSPAEALQTLSTWLVTSGPGSAWISAGSWRVDLMKRTVVSSTAGAMVSAHRSADGRTAISVSPCPALGANAGPVPADEIALLLPGDTLAVCAGSVAWAHAEVGRQALARVLGEVSARGHREGANRLAGLSADSSVAPFVVLIDMLGG